MPGSAEIVLQEALQLPSNDRAALAEDISVRLDRPDPTLDSQWLKEAQDRIAAYRAGELAAVDAEQVFSESGKEI